MREMRTAPKGCAVSYDVTIRDRNLVDHLSATRDKVHAELIKALRKRKGIKFCEDVIVALMGSKGKTTSAHLRSTTRMALNEENIAET